MSRIIRLKDAGQNSYGQVFKSEQVFVVTGKDVRNKTFPHTVIVWDNTGRLNTEPDKWFPHTGQPGPGKYLDPSRKGTDAERTLTLTSGPVVIAARRIEGEPGYGEPLQAGDKVRLQYPDGTVTEEFEVQARRWDDPVLVEV